MVAVIDPILGVQSNIIDIPEYQHEYTKTPVPYNDLLPVPEPPRNMVYPDNAPPVLANINAFYAGARQAQNVHTDGNHALLVSPVGGSGATIVSPIKATTFIEGGSLTGTGTDPVPFGPLRLTQSKLLWVFGVSVALFADPGVNNIYGNKTVGLYNHNDLSYLPLAVITLFLAKSTSSVTSQMAGQDTLIFPNGFDLTTCFAPGADISFAAGSDGNNCEVYAFAVQ